MRVWGLGFRVSGLEFGVLGVQALQGWGVGVGVSGLGAAPVFGVQPEESELAACKPSSDSEVAGKLNPKPRTLNPKP